MKHQNYRKIRLNSTTFVDSQSEPWSLNVGSNPGFTEKLDGRKGFEKIKAAQWVKPH